MENSKRTLLRYSKGETRLYLPREVNTLKVDLWIQCYHNRHPMHFFFFVAIDELIQRFIDINGQIIVKTTLKNKVAGFKFLSIKIY